MNLERLFQPVSEVECEVIEGETPEETATKLAQRLREAEDNLAFVLSTDKER